MLWRHILKRTKFGDYISVECGYSSNMTKSKGTVTLHKGKAKTNANQSDKKIM